MTPVMLTGDNLATVRDVGRAVGIDDVRDGLRLLRAAKRPDGSPPLTQPAGGRT